MIKKKILFSSKAPYANRIEAYLGRSRGNLARTIAPKRSAIIIAPKPKPQAPSLSNSAEMRKQEYQKNKNSPKTGPFYTP